MKTCASGLPTAIFSALMSVSTIILNQLLVVYGNDPVAAIGIVFKAKYVYHLSADGSGEWSAANARLTIMEPEIWSGSVE